MRNSNHFGRGRIVVAVVMSLVVHGSIGLIWLATKPDRVQFAMKLSTQVDGPDDGELVITLREPPPPIIAKTIPLEPRPLPEKIQIPAISPPMGPGEIVQATSPTASPPSAPAGSGKKPLHGKLKAGKTVAYAIDCSSSMGTDGNLQAACDAVNASLDQLSPDSAFLIVAYSGTAKSLSNRPLPATSENRERAKDFLRRLLAEGRSNHLDGMREALWQRPDAVFLLTDADDLEEKEVQTMQSIVRGRVLLNAVLFGPSSTEAATPLRSLCETCGGSVRCAKTR